jgi:hypothetical protein
MDFRKYFSQAQDDANENFFNYDGYDEFDDFDGDFDNFDDYDEFDDYDDFDDYDGDYDNASGRTSAPTSQPYIVSITNTNTGTAFPVTILGAYTNLAGTSPSFNNNGAISITMGIAGISYTEFLYQSMNKPFQCGLTYLQSATANQILETITIVNKDVNGNETQKVLVPTIDPYQQQSTIVSLKFSYRVDGFTSLVISSVLASATAKIYFYPSETASPSRALAGRKPVANYGNPNIVKGDTIKLAPSTAKALMGGRGRRGRRGRNRR